MGEINQDPSMEEILASIKRVIAEEGRGPGTPPRPGRARRDSSPSTPLDESEDVLELNDPVGENEGLMSEDKTEATRQKLAALAAMQRQGEGGQGVPGNDGPLEALVREMLKPMLKEWLDDRLPEIIEDMVAREIARITGKSF
jgi:hypothetical protein